MRRSYLPAFVTVCFAVGAVPAQALTLGQTDDFEDGTPQGWVVNLLGGGGSHPAPPENVADGGPGGAGDNYLLLTSVGGDGAGSRMAVINGTQWAGNYTTEGVTGIKMSLKNFGDTDLHVRLLFERVGDFGPTDVATSDAFFLAAGSDWTNASFNISAADLTTLLGTAENALDSTVIRIFSNEDPSFPPDPIAAQLGVDDINAVPEPGTMATALMGLAFLARRRRATSKGIS